MRQAFTRILMMAALLLAAACTDGAVQFPVTPGAQSSLPPDLTVVRLDARNIATFAAPARAPRVTGLPYTGGWSYKLGPGDALNIIVFDHPELTTPVGNGTATATAAAFRVQHDGSLFYPYIGTVPAAGLTAQQVRSDIATKLAAYIPDPQVEVQIAQFNSQAVMVTGEVGQPQRRPVTDVALTLIEAVNAAGGLTADADPSAVTVQRHGRVFAVNLQAFLDRGLRQNNPVLLPGDIVTVPRRQVAEAFLLGEVVKPAAVDLSRDTITLTQALTRQGGLNETRADARGIFVFRANPNGMTVYQLDVSSPTGLLLGTEFQLQPRDVIYVTRSPLQHWNDTISRVLPTVQAVGTAQNILP